jgi:hypothetical protein
MKFRGMEGKVLLGDRRIEEGALNGEGNEAILSRKGERGEKDRTTTNIP